VNTVTIEELQMAAARVSPPVPKAIAGLIFLFFWAIAIVAWYLVNLSTDHGVRGFIADLGIAFASAGTAGLFVKYRSGWVAIMVLTIIGIGLFAVGDLVHILVLTYFLRIIGPVLAIVILPTLKLVNGIKVFA
jgi:hypothetical protein